MRAPVKPIILRDDAEQRFMSKVKVVDGCWKWQGSTVARGYGAFWQGEVRYQAHRVSYVLFVGELPVELQLDHLCRNRSCVNPEHLEPVTNAENVARAPWTAINLQRDKTHCPKGHPYDEVNTYHYRGERHCRTCRRAATERRRHRQLTNQGDK